MTKSAMCFASTDSLIVRAGFVRQSGDQREVFLSDARGTRCWLDGPRARGLMLPCLARGGRLSVGTMRKQLGWSTLVSRVDLGGLRIHDLRHTGCSRLARHLAGAGEPVHIIRDILGHRSLATTEGYLHTVEDDMVRAAGLL